LNDLAALAAIPKGWQTSNTGEPFRQIVECDTPAVILRQSTQAINLMLDFVPKANACRPLPHPILNQLLADPI